jgi:hypothetical protein
MSATATTNKRSGNSKIRDKPFKLNDVGEMPTRCTIFMRRKRVTGYGPNGEPLWEFMDETRWSSPYHQITIEVETHKGTARIPVTGIRRSSKILRSEVNKKDEDKLVLPQQSPTTGRAR